MRSHRLHYLGLLAILVLSLLATPLAAQDEGDFTLTILHTNDVHAHVEQFNANGSVCSEEEAAENACFGGVARRATMIDQIRAERENTVLVDAGDQFQGSLFYTQYRGAEAAEFMNELGYQAMTAGNHEFDDGPANLGVFLESIEFPLVSANIDASGEPALDGLIAPYTVLDLNGTSIGVVGLTTKTTPTSSSPGPTVGFQEYVPALEPVLTELAGQGIDKIILLSHMGYVEDQTLAAAIDGIDVIVGGHSHTLLSNTAEEAAGPYPTVVNAPNGDPVLVVHDGAFAKYLGDLEVTFDENGVASSWQGDPILLDASVEQDADLLARVQEMAEPLNELRTKVIGSSETDLDGSRESCRFGECNMGNLITDAMVWGTQNNGTQIAITNGGGIRASIAAGDITVGAVLEVLPFGNTIATMGLTGADVVAALENGVSRAENPENEGTGRFPQVSGLRYTWDGAKEAGQRIVSVEIRDADGAYSPIDPETIYQVATNDFTRRGGDGYDVFSEMAIDPYDFGPTLDVVVADYVAAYTPLAVELEGRVTREDSAMPEARPTEPAPEEMPTTGASAEGWPLLAVVLLLTVLLGIAAVRRPAQRA